MVKIIYCDFCNKELDKGDEFEILDWTLHKFDIEVCGKCYDKIYEFIEYNKKLKSKNGVK